jgi:hypothetical protein
LRRLGLLVALVGAAAGLRADGSAVTSASSFKLPRGARAVGMAGAYTALADDSLSLLYNPAGLTQLREVQMQGTHMEWLDGVRDDSVSLGVPLFGLGAWGLGATYLYSSDEGRDNWGTPTGSFNNFDFSMQAAFALQLGDDGSAGLEYKIIRQGYNGGPGNSRFNMGSAFDLGFQYRLLNRKVVAAFAAQNMGTNLGLGLSYGPLPLLLRGGLAWHATPGLSLALDYEHQPYDFFNKWRLGGEYTYALADETSALLRAGYLLGPENASGGLSGFSAGLGLRWQAWQVDYAFVPRGDLGMSHLVSLSIGFGQH